MSLPGPYTRAGILLYALPLYAGPLLAGMSDAPLATLPVFAAAFGLLALKGRSPDLSTASGLAGFLLMLAVQLALVAAVHGLGRLLAWPFGPVPLPLWLPLLLTLAATGFALWRYRNGAELDALLDDALERIESAAAGSLPDEDLRAGFSERLAAMDEGDDAADLAALQFLDRPEARAAAEADGRLGMALTLGLTSFDPLVRAKAAQLAQTLIAEDAGPSAFPPGERLRHLARAFPDMTETTRAIATHLDALG